MDGNALYIFGGQKFTGRQVDVWRRFSLSETTKEAASNMRLSVKTVEYHRMNLMKKLQTFDYARLTRLAIKHGLISL